MDKRGVTMKVYFTLTDGIKNDEKNLNMLKLCLKSAKENTSLKLNALYDGIENDNVHKIFLEYGVNVIFTKLSFADKIQKYYKNWKFENLLNSLTRMHGCFLKFDIALHEQEEDVVLYSDIDTIFMRDIDWDKFANVKTLAVAPEFDRDEFAVIKGYKYFSAGIMLINIPELKRRREELFYMLDNNVEPYQECWDQGFFNHLYKDDFEVMPFELNWKPYWGRNDNAIIVHVHGWKIGHELTEEAEDFCTGLLSRYKEAYEGILYYNMLGYRYLNLDKDKELSELGVYMAKCYAKMYNKQDRKKFFKISTFLLYICYRRTRKFSNVLFISKLHKYAEKKLIKRGVLIK